MVWLFPQLGVSYFLELYLILKTELGDYKNSLQWVIWAVSLFFKSGNVPLWCFSFIAWPYSWLFFETQSHYYGCLLPQTTSHNIRGIILQEYFSDREISGLQSGGYGMSNCSSFLDLRGSSLKILFYLCVSSQPYHEKHISLYRTRKWLK